MSDHAASVNSSNRLAIRYSEIGLHKINRHCRFYPYTE